MKINNPLFHFTPSNLTFLGEIVTPQIKPKTKRSMWSSGQGNLGFGKVKN